MPESRKSVGEFTVAWNANDWATLKRLTDPAVTIRAPDNWPEAGEFEGWPAVKAQWQRLKESLLEESIEVLQTEHVGDDRLLVHVRWTGRGSSGLAMELETWNLNTFRDGLLLRVEYYLDEASARAAA